MGRCIRCRLMEWYLEKAEGIEALEHVIKNAVSISPPH